MKRPVPVAYALAAALVAVLALASPAASAVLMDRIVAVVNKEAITWSELYLAMEFELAKGMKASSPEEKRKLIKESEASFLESMIEVKLQLQEAAALGIAATDKDLSATIQGIKEKYGLDDAALRQAILREGFTEKKYMELMKEQITIRKLVEREVRDKIEVTSEDVKKYLSSKGLKEGVQYRLLQIYFRPPKDEESARAVEEKTDAVLERLKRGEDFASVAAAYSDDPAARVTGGDMGFVERENLAPSFASAIEGLPPGGVSRPFRTEGGVHILKVVDRKDVKDVIFEERFQEYLKKWLKGLRSKAFIEVRL